MRDGEIVPPIPSAPALPPIEPPLPCVSLMNFVESAERPTFGLRRVIDVLWRRSKSESR